jgi:hypothetical protein
MQRCVPELLNPMQDSPSRTLRVAAIVYQDIFGAQRRQWGRANPNHLPSRSFESLSLASVARRRIGAEVILRTIELDDDPIVRDDDVCVDWCAA